MLYERSCSTKGTAQSENINVPQNLSKEEFTALQNLSKDKDLIIQKSDTGNSVVIVQRQAC